MADEHISDGQCVTTSKYHEKLLLKIKRYRYFHYNHEQKFQNITINRNRSVKKTKVLCVSVMIT